MIMRNMSSGATVVVVVVFVGLHVACRGQGLLANIHWDIVDGELQVGDASNKLSRAALSCHMLIAPSSLYFTLQPRVGGLLAQPASHEASMDKEDHVKENQHERMRKEAASQIFDLQVSPSGEGCPAAGELSAGKYGLAISSLGVRCKGCVERADFVDAAQKFLSRVSIRDLKNILALRGAGCRCVLLYMPHISTTNFGKISTCRISSILPAHFSFRTNALVTGYAARASTSKWLPFMQRHWRPKT